MNAGSWEFPWLSRGAGASVDSESAKVTRQGAWVLISEVASSGLGFAFWAMAARLFTTEDLGLAAALVSLSSLSTSIAMLGLDNGLVRFAAKVRNPRRLIRQLVLITGSFGAVVGLGLSLLLLTLRGVALSVLLPLVGLSVILTVAQTWLQVTDAAILAARKSKLLAYRAVMYGGLKVGFLIVVLSAGAVGLFAAYALPMMAIVLASFLLIPRLWPRENEVGTPARLREIATLSAGNWVSGFAYSLPSRIGSPLILVFIDAPSVAFFFIALQLAEVLNYVSEAIAKSLFAHASRVDRLTHSLASSMRGLLLLILVPLVAVGVFAAPFAMSIVGGESYAVHALSLQLFLLAVLPKSLYQIVKAQFNVERRPMALIAAGGSFGVSTLAFLVIGLVLRWDPDFLPVAWILGGLAGLGVAQYMAGWRPRARSENPDVE